MASVTVKQSGKKICCKEGDNLLKVLLAEGIFVDNPCNGKGICGKCKVKILSGQVSAASETEMDQLSAGEREQSIRLSCMTEVLGDVEVELLKKERKHKVLTKGYVPEFVMDAYEDGYGIAIDIGTTTVVTWAKKGAAVVSARSPSERINDDYFLVRDYQSEEFGFVGDEILRIFFPLQLPLLLTLTPFNLPAA